jgi:cAMP-dependent protein kinase regulator
MPSVQTSEASVDQALTLLLADETEAALRWGAAVLEREPSSDALAVTSQLLERMGRTRAAAQGLETAVKRAVESGDLPLAVAAIDKLRSLGADVQGPFGWVADTFCEGSSRLDDVLAPLQPHYDDFQPLSSFLSGPALASRASQIVQAATRSDHELPEADLPPVARLPLFSALPREALLDLLLAFKVITVPAGERVIQKGEHGTTAYVVARGELEVSKEVSEGKPPVVLARLGAGSFFGEMALLSDMPRAASVIAVRPSILLVAERDALDAVSRRHPEVGVELAAHCRRRLVANLGRMSPALSSLPSPDRALLVDRFVTRCFRKGERFVARGQEVEGLFLIGSGAVAIVADEADERVVLATLGAGDTLGEVELVLRRKANTDAVAVEPTAALFLSRERFSELVDDHPDLVHGLYLTAVRRDRETSQALLAAASASNDYELDEMLEATEAAPPLPAAVSPELVDLVAEYTGIAEERVERVAERSADAPASGVPAAGKGTMLAPSSGPPALPSSPLPVVEAPKVEAAPDAAAPTAPATNDTTAEAPVLAAKEILPPAGPPPSKSPRPSSASSAVAGLPARPSSFPSNAFARAVAATAKGVSVAPTSSLTPTIASVRPAPRVRAQRELSPIAIAGLFAVAAVIAGSIATQFGRHPDRAAAIGAVSQENTTSAQAPTVTAAETAVPADSAAVPPQVPSTAASTPSVAPAAAAPAKGPTVATKPRSLAATTPPVSIPVRAAVSGAGPSKAAAATESKLATAPTAAAPVRPGAQAHDEFGGGRE